MSVRNALRTVAEGRHPWGVVEVPDLQRVARTGWGRYRLVLFPPGTNVAERRALTFARRWPVLGALFCLLAEMLLGSVWSPLGVTLGVTLAYVGGIALGVKLTWRLRREVRQVAAVISVIGGEPRMVGNARLFDTSVAALDDLDRAHAAGELTAAQYEAGWARVYNGLDARLAHPAA